MGRSRGGLRRPLGRWYRRALAAWYGLRRLAPIRQLRAMQLRRLAPLAGGRERGQPIVRYYWNAFLDQHRSDIRGRGLEIGDTQTLSRYGGNRLTSVDALDLAPRPGVSLVADLSRADHIPSDSYDCFIVPFTAHLIYDIEAALFHSLRILKPGGVLLINFPCVDYDFAHGLDMGTGRPLFMFWWFTPLQVANLFRRLGLSDEDAVLQTTGNLFTRVAYQMNVPVEELTREERDHQDSGYPLLVCARVVKPPGWTAALPEYREAWLPQTTPARWTTATGHYPR